ncbi:hypothetical protein SAMN02745164_01238 [Marinitoga hydrogenitolerans DSM 16785]|uniref:Heavy-metal chelation domain-containing protein n=1 Tax=Marinitoga hydrogenitolerans (strain DSM 16785 / JCM 12826 / AT1271) TaxID=1122195 RepID=A0A1M4WQK0_MARH1|nr:DUF364 domain-containing protein [Marinitoga hydrogenitolerans]SHE83447.1 hypothetical protein SAMN02745164_01238 [Marinitoga hydrogenitolerans DSM 16785]
MSIAKKLYIKALENVTDEFIEDFVIGIGETAVKLSDGRTGFVATNREDTLGKCEEFYKCMGLDGKPESKAEVGMKVKDLLEIGLFSGDPLLRSVSYAAVNAVFNKNPERFIEGDTLKLMEFNKKDIVGIVGEITPFVDALRPKVWDVLIFDRQRRADYILPDWAIIEMLPKCTAIIITGTTIVNGTIDWILNYVNTDRVAIAGPSTIMVEDVFPVKILSGSYIENSEKLFDLIKKGAGTRTLFRSGAARKVNLIF